ncbi:hypothetical protein J2X85_004241 [Microbacterium trichothecenolyticum]|uniref:hypothetical protein n=1 Tax=Microbacterium trichothecenolyticum TaxID=69370 RepID=UPI00286324A2|nr:hypothetical protein [Microbacterium trichothecenolyticum]MDR7187171.1 hypothetical protein [Microbacterium trichothecenolyticum]
MNTMHGEADVPDPATKPLLHPTDIPEAQSLNLGGWWFGRLASVPVTVAFGAVVWLISGSPLTAIIAPAATFTIAMVSGRWFIARAWKFTPRQRRSREGARPPRLAAAALDALALVVAATAFTIATMTHPTPAGVVAFAIGAAAAVALLQLIELATMLVRGRDEGAILRRVIMLTGVVAAMVVAAALGIIRGWDPGLLWAALFGAGMPASLGAITVLLAHSIRRVLAGRRRHPQHEKETQP